MMQCDDNFVNVIDIVNGIYDLLLKCEKINGVMVYVI